MSCPKEFLDRLAAPFPPQDIEWKVQSARQGQNGIELLVVPYLESRAVMDRLDEVCGVLWQSEYEKIMVNNKEAFQCKISVKVSDEWISRTDAAEVSDYESVKGGHSNALKRAGVQWGIGRYLYDLPKNWVSFQNRGQHRVFGNFKINGQQKQLKGYFDAPTLPDWALPEDCRGQGNSQKRNNQNRQQGSQGNRNNQQNQSNQQKPSNQQKNQGTQQKPSTQQNKPLTNEDRKKNAIHQIKELLQSLNVPIGFVPGLLRRASGSKDSIPVDQASLEDLTKLYRALDPVHDYVSKCRELGLGEQEMLYYCQIELKVKLENIHSLYFKLTKEASEKALKLVYGDYSKKAV